MNKKVNSLDDLAIMMWIIALGLIGLALILMMETFDAEKNAQQVQSNINLICPNGNIIQQDNYYFCDGQPYVCNEIGCNKVQLSLIDKGISK